MIANILSSLMYALKWFAWAFHHLIILPAGTMLLMLIFVFWQEGSTPGRMMAGEISAVTQNVSAGKFRISVSGCEGVKDGPQHDLCDQAEITDASGYAAHIDRSWHGPLKDLWAVLAVVCAFMSFVTRTFPVYWRRGETRSALFTHDRSGADEG